MFCLNMENLPKDFPVLLDKIKKREYSTCVLLDFGIVSNLIPSQLPAFLFPADRTIYTRSMSMRSSGILLHISSLPGPYGIGTMGRHAYDFVDFLKSAGQSYWQILPLSPTGYGNSPYQCCSTFAGNPYLIDLDLLVEEGLLQQEEPAAILWSRNEERVDFGLQYNHRQKLLRLAYDRFPGSEDFDAFCAENGSWLEDYALFMALKERSGGSPWQTWEEGLKFRRPDALRQARQELNDEIRFHCFLQYLFFRQWDALHAYANRQGIRIIGDVPIYVPLDSADVWTDPGLFWLDDGLDPVAVAGCPPDAFTADGQLWGNPLYRWDVLQENGYGWWLRRLSAAGKLYDVTRLDHFRGFESYWAIPYGDTTARNGRWMQGPGLDFIRTLNRELPGFAFIAEDLGYLTPEVLRLREESGYPGMKVLQFAFDSREPSNYLPHTYEKNTVCYTGTHDNMTMRQWFDTTDPDAVAYAREYMHLSDQEGLAWGAVRTAMSSVSDLCIVQMQDLLDLGGEARMNQPGTLSDANWTWRAHDRMICSTLAQRLWKLTALYARLG